jgi:hypothetical protein
MRESPPIARPSTASPTPDPEKPIADRLRGALRSKNPIEAAALSLAVIDSMTLADFQSLGAKPGGMPIPMVGSFDKEFCDGFMDALIERWFQVDPTGAFASIEDLEKKLVISPGKRWAGSGAFSAALARSPRETLLDALPVNATWSRSDSSIPAAFTALAVRDPAAARRYLERITDPESRKSAEIAIAEGIAKRDPLAAVALSHSLNSSVVFDAALAEAERIGPGMLRQVLVANDRKFPIGLSLTELVLRHPDEDWNAFTDEALKLPGGLTDQTQREARRLTPEARVQTLARLDEFPAAVRGSLACALVDAWALEEPRQATEWALAHAGTAATGTPVSDPLAWALTRWISTDESGILAWWSQLPASAQRDQFGATIAAKLATDGKIDRALELFHPEQGNKWTGVAVAIASAQAKNDPAAAAAWLDSLPADLNTGNAVAPLIQRWVGRDAQAAARWVETQPAGERRDAALKAYSVAATELDPAAAGEWAAAIADPTARAQAAEAVFREMNRRDPPAARAFLRSLPETDKAWTERLLRAGE